MISIWMVKILLKFCQVSRKKSNYIESVILGLRVEHPSTKCSNVYDINKLTTDSSSRFSSVGRASDSQIFLEHEFKSRQPYLCNSIWGQDWWQAGCQEVGMCSTRGGSQGTYITFTSTMRIRQNPLWL